MLEQKEERSHSLFFPHECITIFLLSSTVFPTLHLLLFSSISPLLFHLCSPFLCFHPPLFVTDCKHVSFFSILCPCSFLPSSSLLSVGISLSCSLFPFSLSLFSSHSYCMFNSLLLSFHLPLILYYFLSFCNMSLFLSSCLSQGLLSSSLFLFYLPHSHCRYTSLFYFPSLPLFSCLPVFLISIPHCTIPHHSSPHHTTSLLNTPHCTTAHQTAPHRTTK